MHRYTSLGSTYNTLPNPALRLEALCKNAQRIANGNGVGHDPETTPPALIEPLAQLSLSDSGTPSTSSSPTSSGFLDHLVPLKLDSAEMCLGDYCAWSSEMAVPGESVLDALDEEFVEKGEEMKSKAGGEGEVAAGLKGCLEGKCTCAKEERYRPAYELVDGSLERAGRIAKAQS